ncbi:hypothetical protein Taro_051010 [Colocasia esculenta]|uniref:Uncharacterized protein n=1 Tax=Colocasia esculenta TaxID=4460 RepID=A0A843XEV4_COLES|nr:hypothetical protein [Colocasia esculenta]
MKWSDPKYAIFVRVVSTLDQVVSTQGFKYKAKRSSSVDTRSGSVDTMLQIQGSVDTRELLRTPSGLFWDSVSALDQVVSTLVALTDKNI